MSDPILPVRLRRCLHTLLPGLALAASLSAQEPAAVSVASAEAEGADLVLHLNWQASPELPRKASLAVLNGSGQIVAKAGLAVPGPGLSLARLNGFLHLIPFHGPAYRLQVLGGAGRPLAPAEPLRVRLACPEPKACRFRFDLGTSAPGALVVDREMAELLDELPVQKQDLASWTAANAPHLLGDARTLVWQLDSQPNPDPGSCQCRWVFAKERSGGRCSNGDEVGLEGKFVDDASASMSSTRKAGISLRQRCWRSTPGGTDVVTVISGDDRFNLRLGRPVFSLCAAPCAPSVEYEATVVSRAFAQTVDASSGAGASARWSATLLVGGAVVLAADGEERAESPGQTNDRTQTEVWSSSTGTLPELILRSEVAAKVEVPGTAKYVLAVAGVTWRLEARGSSKCTKPEGVAAVEIGRPLFVVIPGHPKPSLAHGRETETGQIRVLSSGECPPGTLD